VSGAHATISHHACHVQGDNQMRYDCTVNLTALAASYRIGVRPTSGGGAWRWGEWTAAAENNQTLWNFKPGVAYQYRVESDNGDAATASLGTPTLPTDLSGITLTLDGEVDGAGAPEYETRYVLLDTTDCANTKSYLVAVNVFRNPATGGGLVPFISWYHDIDEATGLTGAEITGTEVVGEDADGGMLVIVDKRHVYQWNWAGQEVHHKDYSANCSNAVDDFGPCPHHAAYSASTGETWIVTARLDPATPHTSGPWSTCAADEYFVNDGLDVLDSSWTTVTSSVSLFADYADTPYDPNVYEGPSPPSAPAGCDTPYYPNDLFGGGGEIDWTHLNSVTPYTVGGVTYAIVSLKDFNEIALLADPALVGGEADWVINGEVQDSRPHTSGSALTVSIDNGVISGLAEFSDQHDVRYANGLLQFLDNNNEGGHDSSSRVLRLDIDAAGGNAEIVANFVVTDRGGDPQTCPGLGSARVVPGTNGASVVALCQAARMVSELNDPLGNETAAMMTLTATCSAGDVKGWYRAYPLDSLGGN
jgi:hypothetical protein